MLQILILPLAAGVIAQIIKIFIKSNRQKISSTIFSYSGMPSGHSAMVISLSTILGLTQGWDSAIFAFSFIFAVIIIRDALGLRRYLGEHGKMLNVLVKDLAEDDVLDENYPRLLEKIGHTPAQVVVGSVLGTLVSLLGFMFLK